MLMQKYFNCDVYLTAVKIQIDKTVQKRTILHKWQLKMIIS